MVTESSKKSFNIVNNNTVDKGKMVEPFPVGDKPLEVYLLKIRNKL
jgi:hypothetical protein